MIIRQGILNNEQRMLNFEVKEAKKEKEDECAMRVESRPHFFFSVTSKFSILCSLFNILFDGAV
jgi:hypothetical protein